MTAERHTAHIGRVGTAYQLLVYVESNACSTQSQELAALRLLHDEGCIRLVESTPDSLIPNGQMVDEHEVDASLYSLVYDLLHPEHDGGIATPSGTEKAMQVAKAVRHGADVFVTADTRISNRDRPFERQTDMHLLAPADALELVMQEINNAD
ncbi:MAG TPA: hypothetical protein DDY88_03200 [Actinobacteria bacterium]|nr:hypothetical protein [Actinomycetota bacterium]